MATDHWEHDAAEMAIFEYINWLSTIAPPNSALGLEKALFAFERKQVA